MVLLDDVVQVLRLAKFNIKTGVLVDASNGSRVGTTLVDRDLLGQTVQIDGELRKVLKRLHYPLEVMLVCARWYAAYPLSLRHIEEMMQEGRLLTHCQAG